MHTELQAKINFRLSRASHSRLFRLSFNDVHKPSVATIELICNYFGLTLAEFFTDPETDTFYPLTEKERKLIAYWNGLSEEQRDALLGFLEAMK